MLQRKQSLYLLLIIIIAALSILLNWSIVEFQLLKNSNYEVTGYSTISHFQHDGTIINTRPNEAMIYSIIGLNIWSFLSIFLFKMRRLQKVFVWLNFLFIAWIGIVLFFEISKIEITLDIYDRASRVIHPAAYGIAVILLLNILALRGIIADHKLIKSTDRLR